MTILLYLAALLLTFGLGTAVGVWLALRGESERLDAEADRLDLALRLRDEGERMRREGRYFGPPPADDGWAEAADVLGTPLHDYYTPKETS